MNCYMLGDKFIGFDKRDAASLGVRAKFGASSNCWQAERLERKRGNLRNQDRCQRKKAGFAPPSTQRSVQFVATLYIRMLWVEIFVTFSRNVFSRSIRTMLLPFFR